MSEHLFRAAVLLVHHSVVREASILRHLNLSTRLGILWC